MQHEKPIPATGLEPLLELGEHVHMRLSLPLLVSLSFASALPAAEPRLRAETLAVASPYRIPASAGNDRLRYRLQLQSSNWFVPETGEQHVEMRGLDAVVIVCRDCGREAPPDAAELRRYAAPNAWVESDDPALRAFARAAGTGTQAHRMERLIAAVRRRLDGPVDYTRYLSAREAYDRRRGDCTEYALLLAAAARAARMPARVVAGLAYGSRFVGVPHAFGPHAWVQVWDGRRWVSHDAGLPRFDARHIALAVGDGAPEDFGRVMEAIRGIRIVDAARLADQPASSSRATGISGNDEDSSSSH